jgi:hypothetical protein
MNDKRRDASHTPDWFVDTDEEALKNDGKDYQGDKPANTNHGRSGSTDPSAIYADDKTKQSSSD